MKDLKMELDGMFCDWCDTILGDWDVVHTVVGTFCCEECADEAAEDIGGL